MNAGFELMGIAFAGANCAALVRDKTVNGVSIPGVVGFTVWGFWNLWYYPHLDQPVSAIAAAGVALVNVTWLALCWYYRDPRPPATTQRGRHNGR